MSNRFDPDQVQQFNLLSLIWIQTVCKGYQQITKFATGRQSLHIPNLYDIAVFKWLTSCYNDIN